MRSSPSRVELHARVVGVEVEHHHVAEEDQVEAADQPAPPGPPAPATRARGTRPCPPNPSSAHRARAVSRWSGSCPRRPPARPDWRTAARTAPARSRSRALCDPRGGPGRQTWSHERALHPAVGAVPRLPAVRRELLLHPPLVDALLAQLQQDVLADLLVDVADPLAVEHVLARRDRRGVGLVVVGHQLALSGELDGGGDVERRSAVERRLAVQPGRVAEQPVAERRHGGIDGADRPLGRRAAAVPGQLAQQGDEGVVAQDVGAHERVEDVEGARSDRRHEHLGERRRRRLSHRARRRPRGSATRRRPARAAAAR